MIQEIWLESGLDLSEGTQSINLSTDASRKNLLVTTLPQIPSPLPEAMTLNHVRLLYRCIYAHPQTACLALCLAQISFTCGEANISRSVNLMHYRAIWSDTYFQWEFTFIISAWPKLCGLLQLQKYVNIPWNANLPPNIGIRPDGGLCTVL